MSAHAHKPVAYRPLLVLAYADSTHAALTCRQLRRLGWEVHLTGSGPEARRLAAALNPRLVVLDTDLHDESGWLTCAKLIQERPAQSVVLVTGEVTEQSEAFARHAGACALVRRGDGASALINEVHGTVVSSAG
jgi:DNA-binding response OmpR family regulator